MTNIITGYVVSPIFLFNRNAFIVYPTEEEAQMWGVPQKVCVAIAKELSPHFRLVGFWKTDKRNGVIVETDDGEQRLLSHEQYNDLMKARKFSNSLQNRFYNSTTISEFEEWDLWTLNESGDCSGSEQEALFWRKVKEEEQD